VLRDIQANTGSERAVVGLLPGDIEDRVIPGGPTGEVNIRIVKPANVTAPLPVILHSHGGGLDPRRQGHP
jgi:acetyl esterase